MNNHDILVQSLWGNVLFKFQKKCLLFPAWAKVGINHVKDAVNQSGYIKSEERRQNKMPFAKI